MPAFTSTPFLDKPLYYYSSSRMPFSSHNLFTGDLPAELYLQEIKLVTYFSISEAVIPAGSLGLTHNSLVKHTSSPHIKINQ